MKLPITILILVLFLSACSSTEHVANGRKFQKRKYLKGYHKIKKPKKLEPILVLEKKKPLKTKPKLVKPKELTDSLGVSQAEVKIQPHRTWAKSEEKLLEQTEEKLPFLEPDYEEIKSDFPLPAKEPEINVPAVISLAGAILILVDIAIIFSIGLLVLGVFIMLISGCIAISKKHRDKQGTIIAKVLLILSYIIIGSLIVSFSIFTLGTNGTSVISIMLAAMFLIGLFYLI